MCSTLGTKCTVSEKKERKQIQNSSHTDSLSLTEVSYTKVTCLCIPTVLVSGYLSLGDENK